MQNDFSGGKVLLISQAGAPAVFTSMPLAVHKHWLLGSANITNDFRKAHGKHQGSTGLETVVVQWCKTPQEKSKPEVSRLTLSGTYIIQPLNTGQGRRQSSLAVTYAPQCKNDSGNWQQQRGRFVGCPACQSEHSQCNASVFDLWVGIAIDVICHLRIPTEHLLLSPSY